MKIKYIGPSPKRRYKDLDTGREFNWEKDEEVRMPKEIGVKLIESQPNYFTEVSENSSTKKTEVKKNV